MSKSKNAVAFKAGDKVKSRYGTGLVGEVLRVNPPGMHGFVLVRFGASMDGVCMPPADLIVVSA